MITLNPLSADSSEFEYMYQDSNKLVTGNIDINGRSINLLGANALVEWTRAVHPWKTYRVWATGFATVQGTVQVAISVGQSMQSPYSLATPDCIFYGKKNIKLGQARIEYGKFDEPFRIDTAAHNGTSFTAVFYPGEYRETYSNYFAAKSKQIIIPGKFQAELNSAVANITFEAQGFIHIRASTVLI